MDTKLIMTFDIIAWNQVFELMTPPGLPIWDRTLSNHIKGPCRCISIQQGVLVISCLWYSAPQPFTKLNLMVHILVNSYTASKPRCTDCANMLANSWLLNIFRLHPDGILQTVVGWKKFEALQFRLCTNIALSLIHSANTSPLQYTKCTPLPMWRLVFSMVELRWTLDNRPRQNLSPVVEGSVNPSTTTSFRVALNSSPTLLFNS